MNFFDQVKLIGQLTHALGRDAGDVVREIRQCSQQGDCLKLIRRLLRFYKERGRMIQLSVDSENKQIEVEVHLKGQSEPLKAKVNDYEIAQSDSSHVLVLRQIETSWSWINTILRAFNATEQRFPLPEQYVELVRLAL